MADQIDANCVVPINGLRDCELGANPVRGTRQDEAADIGTRSRLEQPGEPAESRQQLGPASAVDRRPHQFDGPFSRLDVYASRGVRRTGAAGHGRDRASSAA